VTLSLAKAFGTTSMTGIDLDEHLIKRACTYVGGCVFSRIIVKHSQTVVFLL